MRGVRVTDRVLTRDMAELTGRPEPKGLYDSEAWAQLRARGSGSRGSFGVLARDGPKALLIGRLPTQKELEFAKEMGGGAAGARGAAAAAGRPQRPAGRR